jgi:polysaccharide export outer membrane protein
VSRLKLEKLESGEAMKRRITIWISLAFVLASMSALAAQDSNQSKDPKPTTEPVPASQAGPSYVIGPDDTLYISVWKEPDLTETLPVRADGMISMPLLNDVQAAGLTPMQLGSALTEKLKKYVSDPRVTIVVTQMNSQRVYVTGEVLHPGAMNLTPNMTVLQALSSAGFTQFANTKGIYVLRHENAVDRKLAVSYKKLIKGEGGQNIALKPGDTIVVP